MARGVGGVSKRIVGQHESKSVLDFSEPFRHPNLTCFYPSEFQYFAGIKTKMLGAGGAPFRNQGAAKSEGGDKSKIPGESFTLVTSLP